MEDSLINIKKEIKDIANKTDKLKFDFSKIIEKFKELNLVPNNNSDNLLSSTENHSSSR